MIMPIWPVRYMFWLFVQHLHVVLDGQGRWQRREDVQQVPLALCLRSREALQLQALHVCELLVARLREEFVIEVLLDEIVV